MTEIPTADEFFEQGGTYPELAIAFVKLHVEAALKTAAKGAKLRTERPPLTREEEYWVIDKQSILDAYPLENIK